MAVAFLLYSNYRVIPKCQEYFNDLLLNNNLYFLELEALRVIFTIKILRKSSEKDEVKLKSIGNNEKKNIS